MIDNNIINWKGSNQFFRSPASDHRLFAFTMCTPNLPLFVSTALTACHNKINWNKVTPEQKYDYSLSCKKLLSEINVSISVLKCKIPLCNDPQHVAFIENFYEQIIFAIKTASKHLLISKHKQTNKFIYGCNNNVKGAHVTARAAYLNWIRNGKIRNGKYYKAMKSS